MIFATLYALTCLPYVPPPRSDDDSKDADGGESSSKKGLSRFLGPAKMLAPQKWRLPPNGRIANHWGVPLLFAGIFTGVLATGYIPTLIQMFSTIEFGFGTKENGVLMSYYCVIRGAFLTFAFPHIISRGRLWFNSSSSSSPPTPTPTPARTRRISRAEDMEAAISLRPDAGAAEEPPFAALAATSSSSTARDSAFDLFFLKWSLVADGVLTCLATFCGASWHVFVVATLLPLASGSASAAKSVMIDMCPPGRKADALGAISLVEMVAAMATCEYFLLSPFSLGIAELTWDFAVSVFGLVFSELAQVGRANLVFVCNAAVAIFAAVLLLGCRFPPEGSERVVGGGGGESGSGGSDVGSEGSVERVEERVGRNGK